MERGCRISAVDLFLISVVVLVAAPAAVMGAPPPLGFQGLGDLPGGDFESVANGLSADGSVVTGWGTPSTEVPIAFRWTATAGMEALGDLPGGHEQSEAEAASANGSVVVGTGWVYDSGWDRHRAWRWTRETGLVSLGTLTGIGSSQARDVSADGSVIIGGSETGTTSRGFRWTAAEGMIDLGSFPGGDDWSWADAVSPDGSVIVGQAASDAGRTAFRWTAEGGMVDLGDLPGGHYESRAFDVSADGMTVVGLSESQYTREAFLWTASEGMVGLGIMGDEFTSTAMAVCADGSIVVGCTSSRAFIWDALHGMRYLSDVLQSEFGIDLTGWTLTSATDISDDGLTITGDGINPNGDREAWLVTIPEPSSVYLLACAGLLLVRRSQRGVSQGK